MRFEIAADIGGTFTDVVYRTDDVTLAAVKSPTTPQDIIEGVLNGITQIGDRVGLSIDDILAACDRLALGTTTATNAVLEDKAAVTGLICTEGHRDVLTIREGGKDDTYNIALDYPDPYIPRELTIGVPERVSAEGDIVVPLDESAAATAIRDLVQRGVEAIAVSLLWSIANASHEVRIGELIEEIAPGLPYSLSHSVSPTVREYRRTSATALDASLKPITAKALETIDARLKELKFAGVLTLVTSNGGQTSPDDIAERPVHLCFSGPSAAPGAGAVFLRAEEPDCAGDFVTVDMGGTSFDMSIVSQWRIPMHREGMIADKTFGVPSVEVHTIGAGGGSIARVDAGGFPHVGPESAGSRPGPACYQRGGTRATVTDANLVLGYLDPDTFADGSMRLSRDDAAEAIRADMAEPMGLSVDEAAALICATCEQAMVGAIDDITIKRGVDPRDYVMVAGGAAAGLHAVPIARELQIRKVLVPRLAGVLSAFGILAGSIKKTFSRSIFLSSEDFDYEAINRALAEMEKDASSYLTAMRIPESDRRNRFTVEARYAGQVWQLTLPLDRHRIPDRTALEEVIESFHQLHESLYSVRSQTDPLEILEINLLAEGLLPSVDLPASAARPHRPDASSYRSAYFRGEGRIAETPIFQVSGLAPGAGMSGPAIVEDALTTIVLPTGSEATLSAHGNLNISLDLKP